MLFPGYCKIGFVWKIMQYLLWDMNMSMTMSINRTSAYLYFVDTVVYMHAC